MYQTHDPVRSDRTARGDELAPLIAALEAQGLSVDRVAQPNPGVLALAEAMVEAHGLPSATAARLAVLLRAAMEGLSEPAWDVLRVCAALAEAPVPCAVIEGALALAAELDPRDAEGRVQSGVEALAGRSLARAEGGALRLDGVVRWAAARQDPAPARMGALAAALPVVVQGALPPAEAARTPAAFESLGPHVEHLLSGELALPAVSLARRMATLDSIGDRPQAAVRRFEQALAAQIRLLGGEHPDTLDTLSALGGALRAQGDLAGARRCFEQQSEALTGLLGAAHIKTIMSLMALGSAIYAQGDLEALGRHDAQLFERVEALLGPDDPLTLMTLGNLANGLVAQGKRDAALQRYEQLLEAQRRLQGEDRLSTIDTLTKIADVLRAKGDLAGAQRRMEQAYSAKARFDGGDHPDSLELGSRLASVLEDQGDFAGARPLREREFEELNSALGAEHRRSIETLKQLAYTVYAAADYAEARRRFDQALEVETRLFGPAHPSALISRYNLILAHLQLGEDAQAATLLPALLPLLEADPAEVTDGQRALREYIPWIVDRLQAA